MADSTKITVAIDPDLLDLTPVLLESLRKDLKGIQHFTNEEDYVQMREKAHSSRGAALTFGFDLYAEKLLALKQAAIKKDCAEAKEICNELKSLLNTVKFYAKQLS